MSIASNPKDLSELEARVAWSRIAEPGDRDAFNLIAEFGPVEALALVVDGGLPNDLVSDQCVARAATWRTRAVATLSYCAQNGVQVVMPGDYPVLYERLAGLGDMVPIVLFARGDVSLLSAPHVGAVVGARAASAYGEQVTGEIVRGMVDADIVIVSGAAYGIEGMAHRAALASRGKTVAVLAGGADRPYPAGNLDLIGRIAEGGLVVSELPPGASPTRWRFLMRNRLIAALSAATIVVEAGARSGSLNTAGHAQTLGRRVGAVPGPISSAASAGCHALIRDYGAALIDSGAAAVALVRGEGL